MVGCMHADFGCMYAETVGGMYAETLGCMRILGACMRKRLGAKCADVWCKSMERLAACLTVGSLADYCPLLA